MGSKKSAEAQVIAGPRTSVGRGTVNSAEVVSPTGNSTRLDGPKCVIGARWQDERRRGDCLGITPHNGSQTYRWGNARLVSSREIYGTTPALKMSLPIDSLCESYGIYNYALGPKQSGHPLKRRSKRQTRQTALDHANEVYLAGTKGSTVVWFTDICSFSSTQKGNRWC